MKKNKMNIFEGLSKSKKFVFDVKKLLDLGVDLLLGRGGEKKRPGRNEQQILRI